MKEDLKYSKLHLFPVVKVTCPWSELENRASPEAIRDLSRLVLDFLTLVSGGQMVEMLGDILSPRQREDMPALDQLGEPNKPIISTLTINLPCLPFKVTPADRKD